jgi:hypothetical protein
MDRKLVTVQQIAELVGIEARMRIDGFVFQYGENWFGPIFSIMQNGLD